MHGHSHNPYRTTLGVIHKASDCRARCLISTNSYTCREPLNKYKWFWVVVKKPKATTLTTAIFLQECLAIVFWINFADVYPVCIMFSAWLISDVLCDAHTLWAPHYKTKKSTPTPLPVPPCGCASVDVFDAIFLAQATLEADWPAEVMSAGSFPCDLLSLTQLRSAISEQKETPTRN